MAAPATLSETLYAGTGGGGVNPRTYNIWKYTLGESGTTANRMHTYWDIPGNPRLGATPSTVEAPDNTTEGSLKQANASGGRKLWLMSGGFFFSGGAAILYDRLLQGGGLSGTDTGAQTVGGSLTRYTDGTGNLIWAAIYSNVGTTATTITASYTNKAGTSGRTTQAAVFGSTGYREALKLIRLPLQSGDSGVKSVESVTLAGTTGTVGNFGIIVSHPLLRVNAGVRGFAAVDLAMTSEGPQEIIDGACLAFAGYGQIQSAMLWGQLRMVEK